VGDRILSVSAVEAGKTVAARWHTGNSTAVAAVYSSVVAVPHGPNTTPTEYVTLTTEGGRDLKMTVNHALPAGACDLAVLPMTVAHAVAPGDCVLTVDGYDRVVSTARVHGRGVATVVAMEELIVVNGVVASPFGDVNPALANTFYNLHRVLFHVAGSRAVVEASRWLRQWFEHTWATLAIGSGSSSSGSSSRSRI